VSLIYITLVASRRTKWTRLVHRSVLIGHVSPTAAGLPRARRHGHEREVSRGPFAARLARGRACVARRGGAGEQVRGGYMSHPSSSLFIARWDLSSVQLSSTVSRPPLLACISLCCLRITRLSSNAFLFCFPLMVSRFTVSSLCPRSVSSVSSLHPLTHMTTQQAVLPSGAERPGAFGGESIVVSGSPTVSTLLSGSSSAVCPHRSSLSRAGCARGERSAGRQREAVETTGATLFASRPI